MEAEDAEDATEADRDLWGPEDGPIEAKADAVKPGRLDDGEPADSLAERFGGIAGFLKNWSIGPDGFCGWGFLGGMMMMMM